MKPDKTIEKDFLKIPVSLENGNALLPEIDSKKFSIPASTDTERILFCTRTDK